MLVDQTMINPEYVSLLRYAETAEEAREIIEMAYHGDNLAIVEESPSGN